MNAAPGESGQPLAARVTISPVSHASEPRFAELLAAEFARAPWLGLSLLIHAAILGLLALLLPTTPESGGRGLVGRSGPDEGETATIESDVAPPASAPEPMAPDAPAFDEISAPATSSSESNSAFESSATTNPSAWTEQSLLTRIGGRSGKGAGADRGSGGADILESSRGLPSGDGFRSTVAQIRKSGLEIVFVVDSTGSMGGVLQGAKKRIAGMLEVLHALVPDTRIGIITYRDSGKDEDYLMRQIPLSRDHYRAAGFVQTLTAKGGGDRDEAVYEALLAALQLRWGSGAQRVVVLVGDAPPHPSTEGVIMNKLKAFASDGRSHVHAIVTSESGIANVPADTKAAFEKIAKAGRGVCIPFDDEETVLRQVLSLAFGHAFRRDLDQIYRIVEDREKKVATWALDIVRRADLAELDQQLAKESVDAELVKALIAMPNIAVAEHLVDIVSKSTSLASARHACGWALQQMLHLSWPPIDPERGGALTEKERKYMLELVRSRIRK